jgi:acyl-CoA synthetase (AMP-forming)/AMP-acid ligase II
MVAGAWRTLPSLPRIVGHIWHLARLKPDHTDSIGRRVAELARRHPDRPALAFEGRRWTYAELNAWANQHAWVFHQAGVRKGDAVGVLMDNCAEVIAVVLGIVKLGAVATLLNPNQRGEPLAHSLRITAPKLVVVGPNCGDALDTLDREALNGPEGGWWWAGEGPTPDGLPLLAERCARSSRDNPPQTVSIQARETCFHIFTSGTTGLPKAARMSHYRWLRSMSGLGGAGLRLRADDVLYCPLPLYHNNALTVSWGAVVGAGACLALGRKFSARGFWDEVRRTRATAFCYIGELCRYLLNQPPKPSDRDHHVRAIIGNGLRPDIWAAFQARFGIAHIAEFYTASECNIAFVNAFGLTGTAGFCPLPFAVVGFDVESEAPVRGPDGLMRKVTAGEVGLLLTEITDKAPLDGYTDTQATQSKVLRNVLKEGDAWFNTGDLVQDMGMRHIQFVDRVGDTFRWKGENVSTTEVEAALTALDAIDEAVVYGVTVPGADGRAGMAAIRLRPGAHFDGRAVAAALEAALPKYAVPLFIRVRGEHEVTATFKYRKVELKKEGFDVTLIDDDVYALGERGYEPLARPQARCA